MRRGGALGVVERKILRILAEAGPQWARSLQHAKPYVHALIDADLVERVLPPTGKARNMLAITAAGVARLRESAAE